MKKTLSLVLLSVFVFNTNAQISGDPDSLNLRDYGEWYLVPRDTCGSVNLDILYVTNTSEHEIKQGLFKVIAQTYIPNYTCPDTNICDDFAQPYTVDTTVRIIGVSGYIEIVLPYSTSPVINYYDYYFEIRDSSLNSTLAQANVWPTFQSNYVGNQAMGYTEVFFDSSIDISNKFYVVFHTPDAYVQGSNLTNSNPLRATVWGTTINCVSDYPLRRKKCTGEWAPTYPHGSSETDQIKVLYLFPILDSTYTIQSNLNEARDISQFTHVFPNPTNNEVNINCGYKIKTLQVFDEQGKVLFEKEVNAYNYLIDLNSYPTGTYLIKVQTNSGQTTKKVIKE